MFHSAHLLAVSCLPLHPCLSPRAQSRGPARDVEWAAFATRFPFDFAQDRLSTLLGMTESCGAFLRFHSHVAFCSALWCHTVWRLFSGELAGDPQGLAGVFHLEEVRLGVAVVG